LGGEKANLFADIRRRDEDPVDGVDDAVLSFKVDSNNLAVEVDPYTRKSNAGSKSLRLVT